MDNKDKLNLESLYESVIVKEQYHIHDLPFDQQVTINTLIDNGFKISGYKTQNGQRILTLRKLGVDAVVDHEGLVNDESVDEFLKTFTPNTPEQPLRGLTNREVEKDIAAQKAQRGQEGYAERKHEHGALHGDEAYNEYKESVKIPHGIQTISESHVVKAKVVRKAETDEFVVKVYIDGKYDEEASYYTNDRADAFVTRYSILRNYKDHGYTIEESKKVNPWAVEKSIEKKTGKKFGKKHKEEIIKGIKKSAKKAGKKITSDKVKSKKKVVKEGMYDPTNDIPNLKLAWEALAAFGSVGLVALIKNLRDDAVEALKENPNFQRALEKLKSTKEAAKAAKQSGDTQTELSQNDLHERIFTNLQNHIKNLPNILKKNAVKRALKDSGI